MFDFLMGNNPLSAVIAFFVVLIPLIIIHELGHFLAAKAVGITVLEFGIGFPPRISRLFNWGETVFTLNWIPLGGFVRPLGEDMIRPVDEKTLEQDRADLMTRQESRTSPSMVGARPVETQSGRIIQNPKAVHEVGPLSRIFFMASGAIANFVLAFVLFMFIALTGVPQVVGGSVFVLGLNPESPFADAGLRRFDIILDVNGQKFANSAEFWRNLEKLGNDEIGLTIQRGETGEIVNLWVAPPQNVQSSEQGMYAQINGVVPGAPADQAGIQPGDIVVAFDGQEIRGVDDFRDRTREHAGQSVTITLRRDQEIYDTTLIPRVNPPEGQGAIGIIITPVFEETSAGVFYQDGFVQETLVPQSLDRAAQYGLNRVVSVITMTVRIPSQLMSGAITPDEARPVSVVGMSQIGAEVIRSSIEQGRIAPILDFIGVISVALGFFNLLPIPALDGGRIIFVLLEMIRGRPIAPEREGVVHLVGLALLLSLSVLIILNDFVNPITDLLR